MANMAGRREILEQSRFRDGNRGSSSQRQNVGDSMHRISNSGNMQTDGRTESNRTATHSSKDEEIGNSNSTTHFPSARTQGNTAGNYYNEETHQPFTNHNISGQNPQENEIQAPGPRYQTQNLPARSASQDLPGLIPPREIDTRPPQSEVDGGQNYRRMAVCQETDDAQGERTKMRVYMKRF